MESMTEQHIYRVIEVVGTSEKSSGHIVDGRVAHFQATIKVGFTLEDSDALAPE